MVSGDLPIPQLRTLLLLGSSITGVSWVDDMILTYSFMQQTLLLLQLPFLIIKKNKTQLRLLLISKKY